MAEDARLTTSLLRGVYRTVKYEEVYLKDYDSVASATRNLREYFVFYNQERLHQALEYKTPAAVYHGS